MKDRGIKVSDGLQIGSRLMCVDNTGAKELEIISVKNKRSVRKRRAGAGIGDMVNVVVTKGEFKLKKQVHLAVIIRQKRSYARESGMRVKFEDNAAILVNEDGTPRGSKIKGPVAKECVNRFSAIGKIATMVI